MWSNGENLVGFFLSSGFSTCSLMSLSWPSALLIRLYFLKPDRPLFKPIALFCGDLSYSSKNYGFWPDRCNLHRGVSSQLCVSASPRAEQSRHHQKYTRQGIAPIMKKRGMNTLAHYGVANMTRRAYIISCGSSQ